MAERQSMVALFYWLALVLTYKLTCIWVWRLNWDCPCGVLAAVELIRVNKVGLWSDHVKPVTPRLVPVSIRFVSHKKPKYTHI